MFAEVVVLTYQGPDVGYFTYKIPDNLKNEIKIGQIVEVPFGKRNPLGVIVRTRSDLARESAKSDLKPESIKPINQVVTESPILLPYQLKLLNWMSNYYLAPTVNCLEAIFPLNETQLRKQLSVLGSQFTVSKPSIDQTLVVVPSINMIPETLAKFKNKNYLIFHNQLKPQEKFDIWTKLLSENVEIVFGSRSAIFLPFLNLKKIIIYDEHANAYKDDRSPYYDSLTILDKICGYTGSKLEIIDSSPKVTTYNIFSNSIHFSAKNPRQKTRIVSMANEKLAGNKSPVSDLLQKLIIQNYKLKGTTLLFLNKKKESGSFFCRSCKTHLFLEKEPEKCPECKSFDFLFNSLNIQSLRNEVLKFLPNAQINLLSEKTYPLLTTHYSLPTIDVATAAVLYSQNLVKYDLLAHISVDHLLNLPEATSAEKTYQQISDFKKLGKEKSILILQTSDRDNFVTQTAEAGDYKTFVHFELAERKLLNFPPFSLLVKLKIKGKSAKKIQGDAVGLVEKLRNSNPEITISGPFPSVFREKDANYNIILKNPVTSYSLIEREKAVKRIADNLKGLSKNWQIIVEPESLN